MMWVLNRLTSIHLGFNFKIDLAHKKKIENSVNGSLILTYHNSLNPLFKVYMSANGNYLYSVGTDEKWEGYGLSFTNEIGNNDQTLIAVKRKLQSQKSVYAMVDIIDNSRKKPKRTTTLDVKGRKMLISHSLFAIGNIVNAKIFFLQAVPQSNCIYLKVKSFDTKISVEECVREFECFIN